MTWFGSLLKAVELALELWVSKEKRKYIDEVAEIKRAYYEEDQKPRGERSNAVLDNLRIRLCIVSEQLAAEAGKS
jgi:hypothetical protein